MLSWGGECSDEGGIGGLVDRSTGRAADESMVQEMWRTREGSAQMRDG